jgi:hypothetical protein
MICNRCERDVAIENKDLGLCASCNKEIRDDEKLFPLARFKFLELMVKNEVKCPYDDSPITMHSDIHHKMGRVGFADAAKREMDLPLLIDPDYFLAVNRPGHQWIESHREEAIAKGWTIPRSSTHGIHDRSKSIQPDPLR